MAPKLHLLASTPKGPKTLFRKDIYTTKFIAVLFTVTKI